MYWQHETNASKSSTLQYISNITIMLGGDINMSLVTPNYGNALLSF